MNELKTLKDLETYHGEYDKILDEAIKWVKKANSSYRNLTHKDFRDFFNITEEDLK